MVILYQAYYTESDSRNQLIQERFERKKEQMKNIWIFLILSVILNLRVWKHIFLRKVLEMKKKLLFTASLFSFILMSSMPAFAVTQEDALEYAESQVNTTVGNGQCVAFVQDYYKSLFGEDVSGDGRDYINNVPEGWTQFLYGTPDFHVKPGDVVSWSWNQYSPLYGHVGIVSEVNENGFSYLDQNPGAVHESDFVYGQDGWTLAGVVRPPFTEDSADQECGGPGVSR